MDAWKAGIAIAPLLIIAMALFMRRQRAISQGQMMTAIGVTVAIAAIFLTM